MPPTTNPQRPPPRPAPASANLTSLINSNAPIATRVPPSLQQKMATLANRNQATPGSSNPSEAAAAAINRLSLHQDPLRAPASYPPPSLSDFAGGKPSHLAIRRMKPKFNVRDINPNAIPPPIGGGAVGAGLGAGRPVFDTPRRCPPDSLGTPFSNFSKIVDPSGALNFNGKAVLNAQGVNFSNGASFSITMNQLDLREELGRGNYGTVKKVLHKPTNVAMAMKEIRLELDQSKLNAILMELDILHRAVAPEIVEFYGAFFIESCVYYCMEFMDAGSLDKLIGIGVPEDVLGRIAAHMVKGLKFLKDELQIIHRDVKPTNVLVNTKGDIKLCDFGVSGQLEHSLAKTNIGCQSYMAPERIHGESQNNLGSYTVSSDVWSLGLSVIEIGTGKYPYPPETYANVFSQLTAIVHGDPPELPGKYSESARDWVAQCLMKEPDSRATYQELLVSIYLYACSLCFTDGVEEHRFLVDDAHREVDMVSWVAAAVEYKAKTKAAQAESAS